MREEMIRLGTFATETASELDVFALDGDTLGVDSAKIGILEEGDEIGLNRLLKSSDRGRLESEIGLEILGDLTNQALEGKLSDEELGRLLVATDLTERDGTLGERVSYAAQCRMRRSKLTRLITMGLLDTTGRRGSFASSLGGELLTWGLATS